jgi:hypothetical protein
MKCDGVLSPYPTTVNLQTAYDQRNIIDSPVDIALDVSYGAQINVAIDITASSSFTGNGLKLRTVLIAEIIDTSGAGWLQTHYENIMLDMAPTADGITFNISPSQTVTLNTSFPVPTITGVGNCTVVAFVQNDATREVLNARYGSVPWNIQITLTPYGVPIVIPASGGSFDYNVAISNGETLPVTFQAWVMVQLPTGSMYGPVLGPVNLNLQGGASVNRDRTQFVPAGAPPGNYTYFAYVGQYASVIFDESSFPFSKSGADFAKANNNDWFNIGESFETGASPVTQDRVPESFILGQNYPNPFNPTTTIEFSLPFASHVELVICDILGKEIETLVSGWLQAGAHTVEFNAKNLPSGVYFYRLQAGSFEQMKKMLLLK